jgi:DNA invertase Pin-like site-specific DNA recombinase
MNKLTPEHLSRDAYVYVRQSTPDQLLNNPESRRRQYALETRARSLGWENVIVIDDDLGRSGGGAARPGFERLLAAICAGTAGAVFAVGSQWPRLAYAAGILCRCEQPDHR